MRYLLVLFAVISIISCKEDNSYTMKGTALGFEDGTKLYLFEFDHQNKSSIIDTLEIKNGKFEATFPHIETTPLQSLKVGEENVMFFVENENINITLYKDSLQTSKVTGGKINETYYQYLEAMRDFNLRRQNLAEAFQKAQREQDGLLAQDLREQSNALQNEEQLFKRNYAQENSNSLFGIMLTAELFARKQMSAPEVSSIIENLSPKMANNPLVTDLKEKIKNIEKTDIGGTAPNFEASTPAGDMLSLKETLGEYTIIDFWASWCRPCRLENPNVVRVYEKYHDKGLNIISVSLDRPGQKDRWIKAIEDDNMDWYHVSNLQFWQDPIARMYNVRSIPATFLLDKDGKIIDKNLRGQALENKISQLLD